MNERKGVSSGNGQRRHGGSRRRAAAVMLSGLASLVVACQPTGSDWIGLNLQLGHTDYAGHWESAKPTATDREIYFGLAGEVGVGHVRDLFMSWYRAEPRQGQPYDFTFSDAMAQQVGQANLDLLGLCWMVPAWAADESSPAGWSFGVPRRDQVDAFVRFVTAFVERYDMDGWHDAPRLKRPIRYYEFMHKMEDVPVADYAFWLQHFYRAVKAADPKAHIVLGGLSSPGFRMIQRPEGDYPTYFDRLMACEALAGPAYPYFDVVSFHQYPTAYPGRPAFTDAYLYLRQVMQQRRIERPVWLTEFGYDARSDAAAEQTVQAREIVKLAVQARSLGIQRAYVHSLWDYREPGRPETVVRFGLVREAPSGERPVRKPAFDAIRLLVDQVGSATAARRVGDGLYAFDVANDTRYAAWHEEAYAPFNGAGVLTQHWWEVTTLDGASTTRHGTTIQLTASPVFLRTTMSPFLLQ